MEGLNLGQHVVGVGTVACTVSAAVEGLDLGQHIAGEEVEQHVEGLDLEQHVLGVSDVVRTVGSVGEGLDLEEHIAGEEIEQIVEGLDLEQHIEGLDLEQHIKPRDSLPDLRSSCPSCPSWIVFKSRKRVSVGVSCIYISGGLVGLGDRFWYNSDMQKSWG